jgi:uncharacterized protein YecA (UPF0149 family)
MQKWFCWTDRFHDQQERPRPAQRPEAAAGTFRRDNPKVGRNDPCPCGSGKKFKKCCGA